MGETDAAIDRFVSLPIYESTATPEQREKKLKFMRFQLSMIKEQAEWGMTADKTRVRCCCYKLVNIFNSYRCLYCGVWYCKECAEEHFGMRANEIG